MRQAGNMCGFILRNSRLLTSYKRTEDLSWVTAYQFKWRIRHPCRLPASLYWCQLQPQPHI